MKIYTKYIIKNLAFIFCIILFTLSFILWLSQVLKLIYVIEKGIGIFSFLNISTLLLPAIINSMMPIISFLSLLYLDILLLLFPYFPLFYNLMRMR